MEKSYDSMTESEFYDYMIQYIQEEYGFNKKASERIFSKAYEDGHAYGYHEVKYHIDELSYWLNETKDYL